MRLVACYGQTVSRRCSLGYFAYGDLPAERSLPLSHRKFLHQLGTDRLRSEIGCVDNQMSRPSDGLQSASQSSSLSDHKLFLLVNLMVCTFMFVAAGGLHDVLVVLMMPWQGLGRDDHAWRRDEQHLRTT